jgi:LysM repeat protein
MPTATAGASARRQLNIPERVGQCWLGGRPAFVQQDVPRIIEQRVASLVEAPAPASLSSAPPATESVVTPAAEKPEAVSRPATSQDVAARRHVVELGDTLSKLALKYQVVVKALMKINGLTSDLIKLGETLKIPAK